MVSSMSIIIEKQQNVCIWTEAGVLNNKLCDRDFHCEQCPLDAALRDHSDTCREEEPDLEYVDLPLIMDEELPEHVKPLLAPFRSLTICTDLRYSSRHVWIRLLPTGMVRCGLDAFAAALLPDDSQIVVLANRSFVREGEEFGWVYGGNNAIPLSAPVSGTVVCRNMDLLYATDSVRTRPYEKGCIVTLAPEVGALATARLSSPRNHIRRIRRRGRDLNDRLRKLMTSPELGLCLNDGGEPVSSIEELFGEQRYWELLRKFVGGE